MLCQKDAIVLYLFISAGTQVPPQLMEVHSSGLAEAVSTDLHALSRGFIPGGIVTMSGIENHVIVGHGNLTRLLLLLEPLVKFLHVGAWAIFINRLPGHVVGDELILKINRAILINCAGDGDIRTFGCPIYLPKLIFR